MDPEQTFLRVHARISDMLAQLISPRLRAFLEYFCLVIAILLLVLLAVMHVNFVSQVHGLSLPPHTYVYMHVLIHTHIYMHMCVRNTHSTHINASKVDS